MPSRLLARPGLHTSALYLAYFMAVGAHVPFWPLWLEAWGLSVAEVGVYAALGVGVRVVAGLMIPALADRLDERRHTLAACALAGALVFLAHLWIGSKPVLLVATLAAGAALAGAGPVAEALGVTAARRHGFAYAQARSFGSLGFLAATLVVGALIAERGIDVALWWIVLCLLATAALAPGHPGGGKVAGQVPPRLGEIGRLMLNPVFARFMAAVAFAQAGHAVMFAYGTIHWRDLGLGEAEIGALWAVSVAAEIVFLLTVGGAVVRRLGPVGAVALSAGAGAVRWGAMMLDPTGLLLVPLQCLHMLTFGVGHLGAVAFIARAVPARLGASAQGATMATAVGLVLSFGIGLAAALYPAFGGRTYGIGVAFCLLGLMLCHLLSRRWRGDELAI